MRKDGPVERITLTRDQGFLRRRSRLKAGNTDGGNAREFPDDPRNMQRRNVHHQTVCIDNVKAAIGEWKMHGIGLYEWHL
jgi:hypothetical protein